MYSIYIEEQGGDEYSLKAAEHIDILTYNRIAYDSLTELQKRIINRVHNGLTAFEKENEDLINSYLASYSINGVSMSFGEGWNLEVVSGVAIPCDLYSLLKATGLCYPAI
ncbi:MAG: hypothetical protein LUF33_00020 [Clostridiales bacterium]|nr:hypothetical protein [Clostridiales bacterium]